MPNRKPRFNVAVKDSVNKYPTVGTATFTYDGNKNLTFDGTYTYSFDTENHLLSVNSGATSVATYSYDPYGRQADKTVGLVSTRFIYDGQRLIATYDGSGALQNRYVFGTGMDELVAQVTAGGVLTFFHQDLQGSVIAISDGTGAAVNKNAYSPYGESAVLSGTIFGYTGQRYDAETGLYFYKNRYYSPVIGRFLQPDPVGYLAGTNLYAYASVDPINHTDPLGLDTVEVWTFAVYVERVIVMNGLIPTAGFHTSIIATDSVINSTTTQDPVSGIKIQSTVTSENYDFSAGPAAGTGTGPIYEWTGSLGQLDFNTQTTRGTLISSTIQDPATGLATFTKLLNTAENFQPQPPQDNYLAVGNQANPLMPSIGPIRKGSNSNNYVALLLQKTNLGPVNSGWLRTAPGLNSPTQQGPGGPRLGGTDKSAYYVGTTTYTSTYYEGPYGLQTI